jgi:mono/diheme cytochrome c family protein
MNISIGNHPLVSCGLWLWEVCGFRAVLMASFILVTGACSNHQSQSSMAQNGNAEVTETTKMPLEDLQTAVSAGKPLYAIHCAACHGDAGKADGIASASLPAKPTDLTMSETVSAPDGKLFLVIKNGKMREGRFTMAPVKKLTDEQIWQVVAYVRTLSQK